MKAAGLQPAAIHLLKIGEPWRARTSDPLIKSAVTSTPAGYSSYDLLIFVTGCSRQRVYLLLLIITSLPVVLSQVCLKLCALALINFVTKSQEDRVRFHNLRPQLSATDKCSAAAYSIEFDH